MTALVWLLLVPFTDSPDTGHRTPAAAAASPTVAEWSAGPAGPAGPAGSDGVGPSPFPVGARRAVVVGVGGAAPGDDGSSATDLILPVAVAAVVAGFAAYSLVRRKRRAALRTTPTGTFEEHLPPLPDLHQRGRRLLVETDDCVRTSAEELRFAVARSGPVAAQPFTDALADARREVEAAFRLRQRLDETTGTLPPGEERALLEEILARCTMAQRRLDIAAPAFDQLRALERDAVPALQSAEARFRELTGRTATAAATLAGLRAHYAPDVVLPVAGHAEQAEDRLVFATAELNRARQFAYAGDPLTAAAHLRAAEGAIDQADVLVTGVERLAAEVARAAAAAKQGAPREGTYANPFDALCREDRWLLPARSAVATTRDYVTTHRGAVGATARTRLTEAERCAAIAETAALREGPTGAEGAGAERAGAGGTGVDRAEGAGADGTERAGADGTERAGADGTERAGGAEGSGVHRRAKGSGVGGAERADAAASPGDESTEAGAAGQAAPSGGRTAGEGVAGEAAPPARETAEDRAAREAAPPEDETAEGRAAGEATPPEDDTAENGAAAPAVPLGDEAAEDGAAGEAAPPEDETAEDRAADQAAPPERETAENGAAAPAVPPGDEAAEDGAAGEAAPPEDETAEDRAADQAAPPERETAENGAAAPAVPPGDEAAEDGAAGEAAPPEDETAEDRAADQAVPLGDEVAAVETADVERARRAHSLAREAWRLAEQDVREYGEPYEGPIGDGMAGALLGGILLGDTQEGGRITPRGPACFGGTATRARRAASFG
ncbi:hypothetical protein PWE32_00740 [Streptomyces neyagawaensis]|uniref:hypothetical protein n=1 Tax=Streptomyces neyagawaensis TaxID=42238 RepID=UPI00237D6458|nr:hypothetical protein [Streptomyces neyagawaensis]MDE1680865.1 hypothetical protein [Streptomyces neyagawaensis]